MALTSTAPKDPLVSKAAPRAPIQVATRTFRVSSAVHLPSTNVQRAPTHMPLLSRSDIAAPSPPGAQATTVSPPLNGTSTRKRVKEEERRVHFEDDDIPAIKYQKREVVQPQQQTVQASIGNDATEQPFAAMKNAYKGMLDGSTQGIPGTHHDAYQLLEARKEKLVKELEAVLEEEEEMIRKHGDHETEIRNIIDVIQTNLSHGVDYVKFDVKNIMGMMYAATKKAVLQIGVKNEKRKDTVHDLVIFTEKGSPYGLCFSVDGFEFDYSDGAGMLGNDEEFLRSLVVLHRNVHPDLLSTVHKIIHSHAKRVTHDIRHALLCISSFIKCLSLNVIVKYA